MVVAAGEDANEDAGEDAGDDGDDGASRTRTRAKMSPLSATYVAQTSKAIEMEAEGEESEGSSAPATPSKGPAPAKAKAQQTPRAPRPPKPPRCPDTPKDPRIAAAEEWLAGFRSRAANQGRTVRARPASLRAYHLWHGHDDLDPASLAALLRDPPLQTNTVVTYILDAVSFESLPYQKARLRAELLDRMPEDLRRRKYAYLSKACGCPT